MYQSDSELVALHAVLEDPSCPFFKVLIKLLWPFWMTLTLTKERELNHLPNCWGWLEIPVEAFSVCTLSIVRKSSIILTLARMWPAGKFEPILTTRGLTKRRHLGDVCKKHLLSHHCGICGYLSLADVYQSGKHLPNWENMFIIDIRGWKDYWHNSLLAEAVIPSVDSADFWLWQIFLQLPWSRRWTLVSNWNQDSKSEICFEAIGPLLLQCAKCTL